LAILSISFAAHNTGNFPHSEVCALHLKHLRSHLMLSAGLSDCPVQSPLPVPQSPACRNNLLSSDKASLNGRLLLRSAVFQSSVHFPAPVFSVPCCMWKPDFHKYT